MQPPTAPAGLDRRTLYEEILIVLSLSLLASAAYAIISLLSAPLKGGYVASANQTNVLARQLHGGEDAASGPLLGQARVDEALAKADIAGDRRPQTLSVADWLRLLDALR